MKTTAAGILSVVLLLGGCSGMRIVDSDVSAFASGATPAVSVPASFRFERLPSQQAQGPQRSELEALAEAELAKVGVQRNDAAPQYSVQFDLRIFRDPQAPWDDPRYVGGYVRPFPVLTRYGLVMHHSALSLQFDYPYYRRELNLLLRRLADGQVVFESRAKHDGRWPDDEVVLPAMFQAALQGFPNPPKGWRRIVIEVPR